MDSHDIDIISIVMPSNYLVNRKYDKIREDIKQNIDIAKAANPNINIRYILEYRRFDHSILAKICDILIHNNIYEIYPSTGLFIDDINDNIIASVFLTKKTGIKCILTGKVWTERQAKSIIDSGSYGISLNSIHGINFFKNNDSIKQ
jgi:deoxyribose-phosphate aldolase